MATPEFKHGSGGRCIVGSTTMYIKEWTFEAKGDLEDVTHMESSGYKEKLPALKDGSGTLRMIWDAANPPMANPPNLVVHAQIALKLYIDKAGSVYWNIAKAFITTTPMACAVDGAITFEANFETSGTFSMAGV